MNDIDALPAYGYHLGQDPIDMALSAAKMHIEIRDHAVAGRAENPESFPGYGTTEPGRIAARIIGDLLGAGWKPPAADEVKAAADEAGAASARFDAWLAGLTNNQRKYAMDYFGDHAEFPDDCRPPKPDDEKDAS